MADTTQYSFVRYEQKYFLTPQQQAALLECIAPHIRRDVYGRYTICSLYYDTDDWRLIRASLEKPAYKEKLRVRSYGVPTDGGRVFVEIKKKYDGVVYKRRITASPADAGSIPAHREKHTAARPDRPRDRMVSAYLPRRAEGVSRL